MKPRYLTALIFIFSLSQGLFAGVENIETLFSRFKAGLSNADLIEGSYIRNATDFYSILLENKIDTGSARIVVLLKPNLKKDLLVPNEKFLCCPIPEKWPYHSFVMVNQNIYDPNYSGNNETLPLYFANFWQNDPQSDKINVYSFQLRDIPRFMGLDKPDGKPRLQEFLPVSIKELIKNPRHLSRRKQE